LQVALILLSQPIAYTELEYQQDITMAGSTTLLNHQDPDPTPTPGDVTAMAEVLEGRHGIYAAAVADFFATYHGEKGDAPRAWAWSGVAELVRDRERARLESR
jgi:hypothetical protein